MRWPGGTNQQTGLRLAEAIIRHAEVALGESYWLIAARVVQAVGGAITTADGYRSATISAAVGS